MARRRKPEPPKPAVIHGRDCVCKGTGLVPGVPFKHANDVTYTKVSARCPGVKTWEAKPDETVRPDHLPPAQPPSTSVDQKQRAAGESEGNR